MVRTMRTLTIFGITGQTGQELARVALERGWAVRGLARPPQRALVGASAATVVWGNWADPAAVAQALEGAQAVVCVLGPRPPYTDVFCAQATAAILAGMHASGVRRIVCQTGAMIGPGQRSWAFGCLTRLVVRRQSAMAADRVEQECLVAASGLAWTLVKPPRLTQAHSGVPLQEGAALRMGLLCSVGRTDLAHYLLDAIDRPELVGARLFVKQ